MNGFDASTYGDSFADVYDDWYPDVSDAEATAAFISAFGEQQRICELGVGTGRLARALQGAGHLVVGVDASTAMLDRFDGDGGHAIGADMAELPIRPSWADTVLVATNTLFNLADASQQQRCLFDSRRVLRLGGRLIVEAYVPGEPDPALDRLVTTRSITPDTVVLTATIRDHEEHTVTGQHIEITEAGIRLRPWRIRYSSPDELDAMASRAGFRLGDRFAGWNRDPFGADVSSHVSVYVAV